MDKKEYFNECLFWHGSKLKRQKLFNKQIKKTTIFLLRSGYLLSKNEEYSCQKQKNHNFYRKLVLRCKATEVGSHEALKMV